jgi:predicted transcriptional regulator
MKTPNELAALLGITPREARQFLRANTDQRAGKGGRWDLSSIDPIELQVAYGDWKKGRTVSFEFRTEA